MLGRFLEISLHAPAILESIEFWEKLGFTQVHTNDVWSHPYAVLTDGRVVLGLHAYEFDSPALTFVRPELATHLPALRALDIQFEFAKTADDQFHEAGFLSPDGQMITLLESRTHSPPPQDRHGFSACGVFDALELPVRRIDASLPFWAKLGLAVLDYREEEPQSATLVCGSLTLRLTEDVRVKTPMLVYRGNGERLKSPEGLLIQT
jgi:hypothetical protein